MTPPLLGGTPPLAAAGVYKRYGHKLVLDDADLSAQSGEAVDKPVSLYRYVIKIGEAKKLASITLPNNPDIKIVAMTLEK